MSRQDAHPSSAPSPSTRKRTGLRVALVAMPWARHYLAHLGLGTLKAYAQQALPQHRIETYSAFVEVYARVPHIYPILSDTRLSELIYLALLHPERLAACRESFARKRSASQNLDNSWDGVETEEVFDQAYEAASDHLEVVVERLAGHDIVGFSTSLWSLYSSLAAADRLKRLDPHIHIVLGGHGVSYEAGPSVLEHYGCVDTIIQGEGEGGLVKLIDEIAGQPEPGCLGRRVLPQVEPDAATLEAFPTPDYDEYAAEADRFSIQWMPQVEGSRGCWYDRVHRTGDLKATCFFCGLNSGTFRRKAPVRVAQQVRELVERHRHLEFAFVDNVLLPNGGAELADALEATGLELAFHHELRVETPPYHLLRLREAGCTGVQFGIEGLSNSYLRRMGKGSTVIRNLQAMRNCFELDVESCSGLITSFPGATEAEVEETAEVIRRFACLYQPVHLSRFTVVPGSTVARLPGDFGIRELRCPAFMREALPPAIGQRIVLPMLEHDMDEGVSWQPVRDALEAWNALHADLGSRRRPIKPMVYRDGGSFLEISDARRDCTNFTVRGLSREIYLYATEVRTREALRRRFAGAGIELEPLLDELVSLDLMVREDDSYLSLAVASRREIAAERIRKQWQEKQAMRLERMPLARRAETAPSPHGLVRIALRAQPGSSP